MVDPEIIGFPLATAKMASGHWKIASEKLVQDQQSADVVADMLHVFK